MRLIARLRIPGSAAVAMLFLLGVVGATPAQQQWGSIKGKVVYGGDKTPAPLDNALIAKCPDLKAGLNDKKEIVSEEWIIDPMTKGLKGVCVYLVNDSRIDNDLTKPIPIHPDLQKKKPEFFEVDQPCCQFKPAVIALQEGQKLRVKNSGTTSHNVNIAGDTNVGNPELNKILPPGGSLETNAWKAQIFPAMVSCNIHAWMKSYVRVFSHPYFAVTNAAGEFKFENAPAGKYRLVIYHPDGYVVGDKSPDKFGVKIEIKAGVTTDLGTFKKMPPVEEKK